MARQLVSHGHVRVNDKKVDIPSFLIKPGDVITLDPAALRMPVVQEEMRTGSRVLPSWLERGDGGGRVIGYPRREDSDADIREDMIVEFDERGEGVWRLLIVWRDLLNRAAPRRNSAIKQIAPHLKKSKPQVSAKGISKTKSACRQKSVPCRNAPFK